MNRVEDCISFLVGKTAQQISRRSREKLAGWNVTPPQYAILKVLWDQDGQSAAAIGSRLAIDSATITGVIDRLEATRLLERRADSEDRRVHRLFLTPRAREQQPHLDAAMDALNAEVTAELGSQASVFWNALRRLGDVKG